MNKITVQKMIIGGKQSHLSACFLLIKLFVLNRTNQCKCFFSVSLSDWHHRSQFCGGVDEGLWGLSGCFESGDFLC